MNMGLRGYLSLIGLGTALAATAWAIILVDVSPEEAGIFGFSMFYVTLAATMIGLLTILMTLIRIYALRREVVSREVKKAFRHAVLFSFIAVGSLILAASNHFSWIWLVGMIAGASIIEYFFLQFRS